MPRPTSATTLQRPDLASLAFEYIEKTDQFVGLKLAPDFAVAKQAADYPYFPKEWVANLPDTKRDERGNYNRTGWKFATDTYSCVENGIEEPVDDVERTLYARYFNAEKIAGNRATATILRGREKRILDAGQALSAISVGTEWDTSATATPLVNVNVGKNAILDAVGINPNVMVIANTTFQDLGAVAAIVDRIKYTHPGVKRGELTREILAEYFDLEQLLVSIAAYNSAEQGQTAVMTKMWNNEYALLACVQTGDDLMVPSYMRTFRWIEQCPTPVVLESYYSDEVRANVVRAREFTDEEAIWTAAAYLMDNIHT